MISFIFGILLSLLVLGFILVLFVLIDYMIFENKLSEHLQDKLDDYFRKNSREFMEDEEE